MTTPKSNLSRFSRHLWLTLGMFVVFVASLVIYVHAVRQVDRANELRHASFLLAEELRQSSDDLTYMVRTYVATGDPQYKRRYREILDIRDGKKPRPPDYQSIHGGLAPTGVAIPLLELMRRAGFSEVEFGKLAEAKANSDALTHTEWAAMALIESTRPTTDVNRAKATEMLHDAAYHQAKAGIMRPISQSQRMAEQRTLEAVHAAKTRAAWMRLTFILFGLLLLSLLWVAQRRLHAVLGGSVNELHTRIARLGHGDFSTAIPVARGLENSVMGWLSETQVKLDRIDVKRQEAEARSLRLTQLYVALSQCNQAIVRCTSEAELFEQVCHVAVSFGGMNMAWIGVRDEPGDRICPVASSGNGTRYLDGLQISASADEAAGRGPVGTAYRENRPSWSQDFLHEPSTAPWHERAARFGWLAVAALPLRRDGAVRAVLALYAQVTNAFDEEARELLREMAADISHALDTFVIRAQREQAEMSLRESERHLHTIIETEPECIKLVGRDGLLLEMNAAGLAMLEADSLEEAQQYGLLNFVLPEHRTSFSALHRRVMKGESGTLEFEIEGLKGTRRWLETHAAPMQGANGQVTMLLGVTRDITARKEAEERIQYLAHFDTLTGLPNRIQLNDRAQYAISLAQRNQSPVVLMFLDIDHFKDINDTLGHTIGDALLVELARRLRQALREEDVVSRLGGDEFIILLYDIDAQGAAQVAQKLLNVIAEPFRLEQYDLNVTGSIGIALYPVDGADLETLSKNADAAMYRVKQEGRHGYRFFTAEMQARSARHLQLVNALRLALERN